MTLLSHDAMLLRELVTNHRKEERWNALLGLALSQRSAKKAAVELLTNQTLKKNADVEVTNEPYFGGGHGQPDFRLVLEGQIDLLVECKLDAALGTRQPVAYITELKKTSEAPIKCLTLVVPAGSERKYQKKLTSKLGKEPRRSTGYWTVNGVQVRIASWESLARVIHEATPKKHAAQALRSMADGLCAQFGLSSEQSAKMKSKQFLEELDHARKVLKELSRIWQRPVKPGTFNGQRYRYICCPDWEELMVFCLEHAAAVTGSPSPLHVQLSDYDEIDINWGALSSWEWRPSVDLMSDWEKGFRWSGFIAPVPRSENDSPVQTAAFIADCIDEID